MPAKFVVKKGPTGKFRFNVVAANGQVIATSEAYETKRAAMAGIKSVQKAAAESAMVEDQTTKEWAEQAAASKAAAKAKKAAKKAKGAAKRVSPRKKAADAGAASSSGDAGGGTASS